MTNSVLSSRHRAERRVQVRLNQRADAQTTVVRTDDGDRDFNGVFHLDDELNGTILYQVEMRACLSLTGTAIGPF